MTLYHAIPLGWYGNQEDKAMEPFNFVWYQARFHVSCKRIYDETDNTSFNNLWNVWNTLKPLTEDQLNLLLSEQVNMEFARQISEW
jgi:hypothetical protein